MKGRFIAVEDILDIFANRYWMYIPGFNGYEVSNDGYIRSMKHYKKYPYGILLQPKKDKDGDIISSEDPIYELSTSNNERVSINLSQLQYLAETNKNNISGYPRGTIVTNVSSRNQKCCIKKDGRFIPKFNIIREDKQEYNPFKGEEKKVICPIKSINNIGVYYGRKDNRTFIYPDV